MPAPNSSWLDRRILSLLGLSSFIDISCVATWKERSRYENSLVLKLDDGAHPGRMTTRDDFQHQLPHLQLSNVNKDGWILTSRKTNKSDNDLPMKNCYQILSDEVGIGKSTGRRHHLHFQQSGGVQENGTNNNKTNGKMNNGGTRVKTVSLIHQPFCKGLAHCFIFFKKKIAYRHQRMSCTRRKVKTAHLVARTEREAQSHIFLVHT